ncbi:O-antigen ligase family protein [Pedobacter sp. SD-b]|uniref:O-antigen ligase family protein n=1 Tax=Pedobacter segetis TaxID=2793069 RepID=A0ABS1BNP9_9SPHI|nr:O-antigen ligase family protein [Pedobacter segetis]MBK0384505.1 O-antigen ligase family protein [Pedobacter segetis]
MPKAESNLNYSSFFTEKLFFWSCLVFLFGLFFSRAILSISCVLLLAAAGADYYFNSKKLDVKPYIWLFPIIYIALIFSGLYSEDITQWQIMLFKNSIYIIIPLAFLFVKKPNLKQLNILFLSFIFYCLVCLSINSISAVINYHQFLNDVANSKNIKPLIGPDHSELGVLSVVAFVLLIYLIIKCKTIKNKLFLGLLLILLIFELHFIAYRFSIISIYLLTFLYSFKELIFYKKMKYVWAIVIVAFIMMFSILMIPSIKNRYKNTITDFKSIVENKNPNYESVGQRWAAIKCAFEIIKKNPILGVSAADASLKMQQQYGVNSYFLIPENRIFIHNQFVYFVLCFGCPFSILFMFFLGFTIYKGSQNQHLLIWVILPFLFHMMIENTLEKQMTANAFIFFWLLLNIKKTENNSAVTQKTN